ncbi:MAG TPA: hypothetical protein VKB78_12315, partial [Pirellulales bacterium]|nr:hypothetical protein [Pirellulales bacterium]
MVDEALFSIEGTGESIACLVVFGPPVSLLGATSLENFGVQADPTAQRLRPIAVVIGTSPARRLLPVAWPNFSPRPWLLARRRRIVQPSQQPLLRVAVAEMDEHTRRV